MAEESKIETPENNECYVKPSKILGQESEYFGFAPLTKKASTVRDGNVTLSSELFYISLDKIDVDSLEVVRNKLDAIAPIDLDCMDNRMGKRWFEFTFDRERNEDFWRVMKNIEADFRAATSDMISELGFSGFTMQGFPSLEAVGDWDEESEEVPARFKLKVKISDALWRQNIMNDVHRPKGQGLKKYREIGLVPSCGWVNVIRDSVIKVRFGIKWQLAQRSKRHAQTMCVRSISFAGEQIEDLKRRKKRRRVSEEEEEKA